MKQKVQSLGSREYNNPKLGGDSEPDQEESYYIGNDV